MRPACSGRVPVFRYGFHEWVVADRRLQFGWRSSSGFILCFDSLRTLSSTRVVRRRPGDETRVYRDAACRGHLPRAGRPAPLPPNCRVRCGQGGEGAAIFVQYYVDDGILVEVQKWPDGRRCRCASVSLESDHYRSFWGERDPRGIPLI